MAVLTAIRAAGMPRLIFSSTGSMYDPRRRQPAAGSKLDEDAAVRPDNPYAATKLAVDLMLAGECERVRARRRVAALLQRLRRGRAGWASGTPRSRT